MFEILDLLRHSKNMTLIGGPRIKLSNGVEMPQIGLGTWQSTDEEVKKAVRSAVDVGYRLIDTASLYKNEEAIGDALQDLFAEGKLTREEIFITTKLIIDELADVEGTLKGQLKKLKTDYVDLYLIHAPVTPDGVTPESAWKQMEKVYETGLAKAIGVSNFTIEQLERIRKVARVPIHNHQIEIQYYLPQHDLVDYCKEHGIAVTSFGSLGSPGRVNVTAWEWTNAPNALQDPVVKKISEKHKKSTAQVLLRWLVQRNIAIIPKSTNAERMKQNIDILDFKLSDGDMVRLGSCPERHRLFLMQFFAGHPEDPFKEDRN